MKSDEMPVGFSMALAQNPDTMQKFTMLSEDKKKKTPQHRILLVKKNSPANKLTYIISNKY